MQFTIKCQECGVIIPLDENAHEHLKAQVRTEEYEKDIARNKEQYEKQKEVEVAAALAKAKEEFASIKSDYIARIASTEEKLNSAKLEQAAKLAELETRKDAELSVKLAEAEKTISNLEIINESLENEKNLAVKNAVQEQMSIVDQLELVNKEHELQVNTLKTGFETEIKLKDEQIQQIKDFRKKQSTKMLGENLEQHCSISFDRVRPLFPNATFGKDNDASEGSKGDFIYREVTPDGIEVLSIMFEMKNQDEDTKTKHKNEDPQVEC